MDKHDDFFGDVFDSPEDDPLLGGSAEQSAEKNGPDDTTERGAPSWMQDDRENGGASAKESPDASSDRGGEAEPERKTIVVDQQDQQALTELNEAVGQGWRLVQISLDRPSGQQAASRKEAERFVAVLEQERPQSLFDFGAP